MDVAGKNEILLNADIAGAVGQDGKQGAASGGGPVAGQQQQQKNNQQQQQSLKTKRKHRRGKPKSKNTNKPYKKTNWKFQVPRYNYNNNNNNGCTNGMNNNRNGGGRVKLMRSRSLVPYNTNKFLMEEHLAEVPSSLLTPSGRTRDSSFSVDSEDNYFFSLPEDEEEFLTKEFSNVYEKARLERLESLTKQQLIEEILTIEDKYSDQSVQRQQQLNVQRISTEFMNKIRVLEEKIMELSRENYNLRCRQLMRSAALAAAASPPSATVPMGGACEPMDSSSEDSESDSSSTSSSSSSSDSEKESGNVERSGAVGGGGGGSGDGGGGACGGGGGGHDDDGERCSSRSSLTIDYIANGHIDGVGGGGGGDNNQIEYERQQLLEAPMEEDEDIEDGANNSSSSSSSSLSNINQQHNNTTIVSLRNDLNSSSESSAKSPQQNI